LLPLAETFAALPNTNMIGSLQLLSSTGTSDSNAVGRGFDPRSGFYSDLAGVLRTFTMAVSCVSFTFQKTLT